MHRTATPDPAATQPPDLIAGFYAAAAHEDAWGAPWSALCAAFAAETGLLYRQSRASDTVHVLAARNWPGLPARAIVLDPAAPHAAPDNVHVLSATIPLDGTTLVGMGLHRPIAAPRFTEADRRALDGVGRHIASALRLETMLAASRAASDIRSAALDLLPHGVVICTGAGTLVLANRAAHAIAEANDIDIGIGRACLAGLRGPDAIRLEELITSVGGGRAGGTARLSRAAGAPAIAATVAPLPVRLETALAGRWQRTLVMITLRDLGATADASPALLIDLFGLTAAEAGILPQLLAGDTASMIAQTRGVAVSTVKAQVTKVLAKTGAGNLRALATMISSLG
jgi:DNA-binding CsgD family transcriptional regulator/GAF domain-containing protein